MGKVAGYLFRDSRCVTQMTQELDAGMHRLWTLSKVPVGAEAATCKYTCRPQARVKLKNASCTEV